MSTVQLPGPNIFNSHMKMHTGTKKYDVSLAQEFQHFLTKKNHKDGVIDQGKHRKRFTERKWTYRHYHVQNNADVEHHLCGSFLSESVEIPELNLHHIFWCQCAFSCVN